MSLSPTVLLLSSLFLCALCVCFFCGFDVPLDTSTVIARDKKGTRMWKFGFFQKSTFFQVPSTYDSPHKYRTRDSTRRCRDGCREVVHHLRPRPRSSLRLLAGPFWLLIHATNVDDIPILLHRLLAGYDLCNGINQCSYRPYVVVAVVVVECG